MISITQLWCNKDDRNHALRYAKPRNPEDVKPVVVWNSTQRCNLKCRHCYSMSENTDYHNELTTEEAKRFIDDLATFGTPCLLFSGGEPLMRPDLVELLNYCKEVNLPTAISTNGTLITDDYASSFRDAGVRYVGISLDGVGEVNDAFRGVPGTFEKVTNAFRILKRNDVKSGLRFTLSKDNLKSLVATFRFIEEAAIERICFYHVVPVGRASDHSELIPSHRDIRDALDHIVHWTANAIQSHPNLEVLTVDNHADNIYLYLKAIDSNHDPKRIVELIKNNGGAKLSSGVGIAAVDPTGNIHPDQFWLKLNLGNIRNLSFSKTWSDRDNWMLDGLRHRTRLIGGRCGGCHWLELCGGGLRSRADARFNDPWAEDPGCYLTDSEIGI